jgi:hypothetical protein
MAASQADSEADRPAPIRQATACDLMAPVYVGKDDHVIDESTPAEAPHGAQVDRSGPRARRGQLLLYLDQNYLSGMVKRKPAFRELEPALKAVVARGAVAVPEAEAHRIESAARPDLPLLELLRELSRGLRLPDRPGVPLGSRRRAFSVRFLGDDAKHAPRPWKTSPDFPGLADELPAGAPMDHPLFPVLWERDRRRL